MTALITPFTRSQTMTSKIFSSNGVFFVYLALLKFHLNWKGLILHDLINVQLPLVLTPYFRYPIIFRTLLLLKA